MEDYLSLYSAPFQFIQLANGSIPEIRFAENEVDTRVKNFKRHIVDAFSTQLSFDQRRNKVVETSVIGEHSSNYNISINAEKANLNSGGASPLKQEKPTVVVKKVVTGDDVLRLAPSPAVNDRDKMDLKLEQVQIFQEGRMISSSGISSLTLLPTFEKKNNYRLKREDSNDVTSYMQAQTTFDIQLQSRQRRSSAYSIPDETDNDSYYQPASRMAEMEGKLF
ncbi:uncharacterized protein CDAR_20331 [Caerostris darwini]|uniref:Vitellogenin domain-containing protein n=1 Tax=Caerostris darwini TaxID=1538125 RepID=A0AAV4PCW2_9ARAC|nr:uncharacterized protein CDAR_20331 [Caerostris darwini]